MALLKEMIVSAKEVGVDICKIQVYESMRTLKSDKWKYLEYSDAQLDDLFAFAADVGMPLFASVFTQEDFDRMRAYRMPAYKIASRTVTDRALCRSILETGAPVICSLGGWNEDGFPFAKDEYPHLFYLRCVSEYPTPPEKADYAFGDFENAGFDGVSDHSVGPAVVIAAIAHGARIVERHMSMTRYRYEETEKAHLCSSDPDEFRLIRSLGDRISLARKLSGVALPQR
jgi:sialic acid synthase SpsE